MVLLHLLAGLRDVKGPNHAPRASDGIRHLGLDAQQRLVNSKPKSLKPKPCTIEPSVATLHPSRS